MTREEAHERILEMLKSGETITRTQICMRLGIPHNSSNDRLVRFAISEIAKEYPIISVSAGKGYSLAKDADSILHQIRENDKRARKTQERNAPLYKALEQFGITERLWGTGTNG